MTKKTVYRMGSIRNSNAKIYSEKKLAWIDTPVNILGVQICHDMKQMMKINFEELICKSGTILQNWKRRNPSLIGKVQVINTLVASLFVYRMTVFAYAPR